MCRWGGCKVAEVYRRKQCSWTEEIADQPQGKRLSLRMATHRQLHCLWVMQVVQQASKLEVLHVSLTNPCEDDYQLLASLPALRKLAIEGGCTHEKYDGGATLRCHAQLALPHVSIVRTVADGMLDGETFLSIKWALK